MGNSWKGGQVWCLVFFVRETRVYLKTSEEVLASERLNTQDKDRISIV